VQREEEEGANERKTASKNAPSGKITELGQFFTVFFKQDTSATSDARGESALPVIVDFDDVTADADEETPEMYSKMNRPRKLVVMGVEWLSVAL
jgi:hypothetical protein